MIRKISAFGYFGLCRENTNFELAELTASLIALPSYTAQLVRIFPSHMTLIAHWETALIMNDKDACKFLLPPQNTRKESYEYSVI